MKIKSKQPKIEKGLMDFKPTYGCRFHPTDWWHEVGCPHRAWGVQDLQSALDAAKQSNAYLTYLVTHPNFLLDTKHE